MPHASVRKPQPQLTGQGMLSYPGFTGEVAFEIRGDPAELRHGKAPLRGQLRASPEQARAAFRQGRVWLRLDESRECRLMMIAHTQGSDTAYFEIEQ
jgi:hypothetical protein